MIWISDDALERLAQQTDRPELDRTRYRLGEELDRGGMGVVYLAEDLTLGREVALKVLRDGLPDADGAARLEREARILAGLEHPGIVPVHDAGTLPDGRSWYAMKRVRGARLDAVARDGVTLAESLRLFGKICEPVAFAHARGIVHRDLKPQNVMVGESGEVLVMDWGIAKVLDAAGPSTASRGNGGSSDAGRRGAGGEAAGDRSSLTAEGAVVGTRGYMAPEQQRGDSHAIGPATDVWALGVILGALARSACERVGARVPKALAAITAKATADDPAERYASASGLADDVLRFVDGGSVTAYRESLAERLLRWLRANKTAVAVVIAYLVMRALILLVFGR